MKIRKLLEETRNVFIPPKKIYYLGRLAYGTPYFYPWNFNSTILTIRKNRPKFLRCKYFKLFGYEISYGWPIMFHQVELGWKDKWDFPRFEWAPSFQIYFFKWQLVILWTAPDGDDDKYYEQILWWRYNNWDLDKARQTWNWVDYETKQSTWNDEYLE